MFTFKPKWVDSWSQIYKEGGFKLLINKKGYKVLFAFVLFYLIRDSILFLVIPYFGYSHFSSCF